MAEKETAQDDSQKMETNHATDCEEKIHYIGERSAIVFCAAFGEALPSVELPDDFFELSKEDVKTLFKELKQNRQDAESQPLRTKAVREMEESASQLSRLKRYTQTVIRIQFPDRLVLQAVFNHSDTVQTVADFLRGFLDPPEVQFYLYTAPPKSILKMETTLTDAKLTPRALLYFGVNPPENRTTYLKSTFTANLTCPRLASEAALQYRRKVEEVEKELSVDTLDSSPTPSTSKGRNAPSTSKRAPPSSSTKVPKWFKP